MPLPRALDVLAVPVLASLLSVVLAAGAGTALVRGGALERPAVAAGPAAAPVQPAAATPSARRVRTAPERAARAGPARVGPACGGSRRVAGGGRA